ncbi:hypothetical protein HPB51_016468 [Rhipicephalus microplus]|uniref:BSD domain-containing protein n=1 Tax=Rhipicephalus microplus TaxID=6941 RepID=A0A9J6DV78_RHIMP|nr:hypothetical protein HPB51_016468 [Rhipicephalus microplus]
MTGAVEERAENETVKIVLKEKRGKRHGRASRNAVCTASRDIARSHRQPAGSVIRTAPRLAEASNGAALALTIGSGIASNGAYPVSSSGCALPRWWPQTGHPCLQGCAVGSAVKRSRRSEGRLRRTAPHPTPRNPSRSSVKRKHLENVPERMTESEFWTRFFQSHYFHRDRLHTSTRDLFSDCARSDDKDIQEAISKGFRDPFVDISSFQDIESFNERDLPGSVASAGSVANHSMIRRFNHHSMMVLRACGNDKDAPMELSSQEEDPLAIKHARVWEKTQLEDLLGNNGSCSGFPVRLGQGERHQRGPTAGDNSTTPEDRVAPSVLQRELSNWTPSGQGILPASAALSVLGELSPGGALMKNAQQVPLKDTVSLDVQRDLRSIYTAQFELLRHFWTCFPSTSAQLEEKAINMRSTLERFQYAQLQPFRDKLLREHHTPDVGSLKPRAIPLSGMACYSQSLLPKAL